MNHLEILLEFNGCGVGLGFCISDKVPGGSRNQVVSKQGLKPSGCFAFGGHMGWRNAVQRKELANHIIYVEFLRKNHSMCPGYTICSLLVGGSLSVGVSVEQFLVC